MHVNWGVNQLGCNANRKCRDAGNARMFFHLRRGYLGMRVGCSWIKIFNGKNRRIHFRTGNLRFRDIQNFVAAFSVHEAMCVHSTLYSSGTVCMYYAKLLPRNWIIYRITYIVFCDIIFIFIFYSIYSTRACSNVKRQKRHKTPK
jgi:hypothetical protein